MIKSAYSFMRTRSAKTHIQSHSHDRYEFVYFFNGKGTLEYENKAFTFTPNSYYLMVPNTLHSELYENTGKSLVLWFNLTEEFSIKSVAQYDIALNLNKLAEQIRQEMHERLHKHDLIIDALMSEITVLVARQQYSKSGDSVHMLQNTINYIDEYYMTAIKISDLAEECGYSVDHYRLLFHKMTKQNPKDYILSKRLKMAKKLLNESRMSISDICFSCGFEYYSQFIIFFKNKMGMTPNEYRKRKRN